MGLPGLLGLPWGFLGLPGAFGGQWSKMFETGFLGASWGRLAAKDFKLLEMGLLGASGGVLAAKGSRASESVVFLLLCRFESDVSGPPGSPGPCSSRFRVAGSMHIYAALASG